MALECLGPEFTPQSSPQYFEKGHAESPLLTANIFSLWTFSWMNKLMKKGMQEYITENDLPGLRPEDETVALGNRLKSAMDKQYVSFNPGRLLGAYPHHQVLRSGLLCSRPMADRTRLLSVSSSFRTVWHSYSRSYSDGCCITSRRISLLGIMAT